MFGRKSTSQPTPKDTAETPETEDGTGGKSTDTGSESSGFTPGATASSFVPERDTPTFRPEAQPTPSFSPSPSMATPPLKPFAQRGTQMPSRPSQAPYKQPDPTRRALDIPGHGPRRAETQVPDGKTLTVGREIQLSGEISACDHLIVEGKVQANLSSARILEVSEGGEFRGTVSIEEATVSGLFEGEMTVTRLLTVRPSGRVTGTVRYQALIIEEGGRIKGELAPLDDEPA
jgi:cytoskeletal protein CcmA (bactofilin family)